ncbi:MAG: hypothetical protein ACYCQI_00330 [Gammaproteobacteria bacterium]
MLRSSEEKTAKKSFQNLSRDLFFHTLDFCSTKEIFTHLGRVNHQWNGYTKEEFALNKLAERCETHSQYKNKESLLEHMLLYIDNDGYDVAGNYLVNNGIPLHVGFRTLAEWRQYLKDDLDLEKSWLSFHSEIAKKAYPLLSKQELQKKGRTFFELCENRAKLYKRFKNKEKLTHKEYANLLKLYQESEELSRILIDIAVMSLALGYIHLGQGPNSKDINGVHKLLESAALPNMTSHALIVLMNVSPPIFPLGFDDPALKPHLSKFTKEELEFVKKYNIGNWLEPVSMTEVIDTPTMPVEKSIEEGWVEITDESTAPPETKKARCLIM